MQLLLTCAATRGAPYNALPDLNQQEQVETATREFTSNKCRVVCVAPAEDRKRNLRSRDTVFTNTRSNRRAITDDVDASLPLLLESGATGAGAGAGVGVGAGGGAEVNGGEDEETYVEEEALDDDEFEELEACNMERDDLENDDLGRMALPDTEEAFEGVEAEEAADAFEGVAAEEAAEAFEGVEVEEACVEYSAFPDNMPLIMAAASGVSAAARGQH